MKYRYLLIIMILFASCSTIAKGIQSNNIIVTDIISTNRDYISDKESEYFKLRNNYVEHLQGLQKAGKNIDSLLRVDNEDLKELENRLRVILRKSHFSGQGKINLETLLGFLGFGMLDGLTFEKDSLRIFYTSKNIFLDYFRKENISQLDNLTPKNLEDIFQSAYSSDIHLSNYSSLKVQSKDNIQAFGMVGMYYQMIGPWPPEYLFVFVSNGNYIYMCEKHLKKPIKEIDDCRSIYNSKYQDAEKQLEVYHSSNLKDTTAFNNHLSLWEEAMVQYCNCYQKELKNDNQFVSIQKEIDRIVNFIEQNNDK